MWKNDKIRKDHASMINLEMDNTEEKLPRLLFNMLSKRIENININMPHILGITIKEDRDHSLEIKRRIE